MNSHQNKQAQALAALSAEDRVRLERLAAQASVTPEHLWPDVWLYGFDDVQDGITADLRAAEDVAAGRTISNEEVMKQTERTIDSYGKQKRCVS